MVKGNKKMIIGEEQCISILQSIISPIHYNISPSKESKNCIHYTVLSIKKVT